MPTLNKEWKKEAELRDLKTELAALDRKITLDLAPNKSEKQDKKDEQDQDQKEGIAAEARKSVSLHADAEPEQNVSEPKKVKGYRI